MVQGSGTPVVYDHKHQHVAKVALSYPAPHQQSGLEKQGVGECWWVLVLLLCGAGVLVALSGAGVLTVASLNAPCNAQGAHARAIRMQDQQKEAAAPVPPGEPIWERTQDHGRGPRTRRFTGECTVGHARSPWCAVAMCGATRCTGQ